MYLTIGHDTLTSKTLTKLLVVLIILVVTSSVLIFTSGSVLIPQNDIVSSKTETLFSFLEESNSTVINIYKQLEEDGITIPQESINEYEKASVIAEESQSLVDTGNYSGAENRIIQALDNLKEALKIAYESIQDQSPQPTNLAEQYFQIQSSIKRYFELLGQLQNQTILVSLSDFNTTALIDKMQIITSILNRASNNLDQNRFEAALRNINEAKSLSNSVIVVLQDFAINLKTQRLETYIENTEKRLLLIRQTTISLSATYPTSTIDASFIALEEAETSLNNAKSYLDSNQINDTLNELINSKASEEQALDYLRPDTKLDTPALTDSSQVVTLP